jgi:hypothetical protein
MHTVAAIGNEKLAMSTYAWVFLILLIPLAAYALHKFWGDRPRPSAGGDTGISSKALLVAGMVFLFIAGIGLYAFYPHDNIQNTAEALSLSAVVLVGLALIVLLMAVLVIVYQVLGLADRAQALALPEGSIRALIAFSLVLIFVCLAAFLYNSVNNAQLAQPGKVSLLTEAQLNELKTQFVVAYEPAKDAVGALQYDVKKDDKGNPVYDVKKDDKGNPLLGTDGKPTSDPTKPLYDPTKPLYSATYYVKHGSAADDFAKQIFTTLSTVFVSVISFYFGSSVVSSAVKAARDGGDGGTKVDPQAVLSEVKVSAHDAQAAADRATAAATSAAALAAKAPENPTAQADAAQVKDAQAKAAQSARDASQQVDAATKAAADAAAAGTDATKASTAGANMIKARDAAKAAADTAKQTADDAERLLQQMKTPIGDDGF